MASQSLRDFDRSLMDQPLTKKPRYCSQTEDERTLLQFDGSNDIKKLSSEVDLNGGDSGFQDLVSNGSPSSSNGGNGSVSGSGTIDDDVEQNFSHHRLQTDFFSSNHSKSCLDQKTFVNSDLMRSQKSSLYPNNSSFSTCTTSESDSNANSSLKSNESNVIDGEDDVDDDQSSVISDISCLSSLSDLEDAEKWQSNFEPISWVQQQITSGTNPRQIINEILPNNSISSQVDNWTLWKFIVNILSEPPKRRKLPLVNSLQDVVHLIGKSKRIMVLTGAGVSVSSGIPDFRSRDGIYARLSVDFPDLPDPQAMFDINYFHKDQRPFFKFAKEIYPGQFQPSICHKFIKQIEKNGKLLRNYTQNIDTLEQSVGIERVITCHGSFKTATCTHCKHRVSCEDIRADIFAQRIPICNKCGPLQPKEQTNPTSAMDLIKTSQNEEKSSIGKRMSVLKPDIVFFGEGLPDEFHDSMSLDKSECDLLIVIGSSLKVKPVALIPSSIPPEVPQILINREPLPHMTFDVELLGDCDVIVQELCHRLGQNWNEICVKGKLNEQLENSNFENYDLENADLEKSFLHFPPNRYVFKGAELNSWKDSDSSDEDI